MTDHPNSELVFLDVDNTLIRGYSQEKLLIHLWKRKLISPMMLIKTVGWTFLYKLHLTDDPGKIFSYALGSLAHKSRSDFDHMILPFIEKELRPLLYPGVSSLIRQHKEKGRRVVLLSTAIEPLVSKIAEIVGADDHLATQLSWKENIFMGSVSGSPLYGKEKVKALISYSKSHNAPLKDAWAYADDISDFEMLSLVGHPVATNPKRGLRRLAKKSGWPIISLQDAS